MQPYVEYPKSGEPRASERRAGSDRGVAVDKRCGVRAMPGAQAFARSFHDIQNQLLNCFPCLALWLLIYTFGLFSDYLGRCSVASGRSGGTLANTGDVVAGKLYRYMGFFVIVTLCTILLSLSGPPRGAWGESAVVLSVEPSRPDSGSGDSALLGDVADCEGEESDFDGDRLSDCVEREILGTDYRDPDSDHDGLSDGLELWLGLDPCDSGRKDDHATECGKPFREPATRYSLTCGD